MDDQQQFADTVELLLDLLGMYTDLGWHQHMRAVTYALAESDASQYDQVVEFCSDEMYFGWLPVEVRWVNNRVGNE